MSLDVDLKEPFDDNGQGDRLEEIINGLKDKIRQLEELRDALAPEVVYNSNITHNLNKMAQEAGIYYYCWRPDELGITKAKNLIEPLTKGLELLRADPDRFKKLNPENGWGDYEVFVEWVEKYLQACKEHPEAIVEVSR